jgi:fatty acid desaturase
MQAVSTGILRHSTSDAVLVALSFAHAGLFFAFPSSPLIALGLWWNANTISHNFVHLPFFRSPVLNRLYSIYLTLLLSIPHSIWRERHLRHHSGRDGSFQWTRVGLAETGMIAALWIGLVWTDPQFLATVYLPGYLAGLALCHVHGHFEHARGTTSCYGRLYNLLFFNDGYHVEHHLRPGEHWTRLPRHDRHDVRESRWPPVLRWLDWINLEVLEHVVLHSTWLQSYIVSSHERAFRRLLRDPREIRQVTIIGGGLFPRTALVLMKVLPAASLTIVDASARNLDIASRFLNGAIALRHRTYRLRSASQTDEADATDLVVIPLAFVGDRDGFYRDPPAPRVLVHDWIWRRRAEGVIVSWFLLKRLNLITR